MTVLAHILQHVPLQQRLTECALVCKSWSAAAVLAAQDVQHRLTDTKVQSCQAWLQHAGELRSLDLASPSQPLVWENVLKLGPWQLQLRFDKPIGLAKPQVQLRFSRSQLQLPWAKLKHLQKLRMTGLKLSLGPADNQQATLWGRLQHAAQNLLPRWTASASSSSGCNTVLEELTLQDCELSNAVCLLQLGQGQQHLTKLALNQLRTKGMGNLQFWGTRPCAQLQEAVSILLPQLPQLSVVELAGVDIGPAAVQHLSAMTRLQHLSLHLGNSMESSCLQLLPSSVTRLMLDDNSVVGYTVMGHPKALEATSLPPQLEGLPALVHLQVTGCALHPKLLANIPQMKCVHLEGCKLWIQMTCYKMIMLEARLGCLMR